MQNDNIGGFSKKVNITLTNSTSAYTAGDNLGGIIKLKDILRKLSGTGILYDLQFCSKENKKPKLTIDLWSKSPSVGTYTDKTAQVVAGDEDIWLGNVKILDTDWDDIGAIARVHVKNIGLILQSIPTTLVEASSDIYLTIQINTATTWADDHSLFGKVGILQD